MVLRCRLAGLYYFTRNAFALKGENMKIIIVGCGKVGTALTAQLSREDNLVTVIDTDSIVVRNVSNTYDVMGIVGNGASYQVLQEADIEHADLMIAVTKSMDCVRKWLGMCGRGNQSSSVHNRRGRWFCRMYHRHVCFF